MAAATATYVIGSLLAASAAYQADRVQKDANTQEDDMKKENIRQAGELRDQKANSDAALAQDKKRAAALAAQKAKQGLGREGTILGAGAATEAPVSTTLGSSTGKTLLGS